MVTILSAIVLVAQDVGGRGENFDQGTGLVTIAVIAAVVLILGCLLAAFFTRSRARARAMRRRPDSQGHAGRVGEFRSR